MPWGVAGKHDPCPDAHLPQSPGVTVVDFHEGSHPTADARGQALSAAWVYEPRRVIQSRIGVRMAITGVEYRVTAIFSASATAGHDDVRGKGNIVGMWPTGRRLGFE